MLIFLYGFLIWVCLWSLFDALSTGPKEYLPKLKQDQEKADALVPLKNVCLVTSDGQANYWAFSVCFGRQITQFHIDASTKTSSNRHSLGRFVHSESTPDKQIYREHKEKCQQNKHRHAKVKIECCVADTVKLKNSKQSIVTEQNGIVSNKPHEQPTNTWIDKVLEPHQCYYEITVCSELICATKPSYDIKAILGVGPTGRNNDYLMMLLIDCVTAL
jgi:hypothetical protein